MSAFQTYQKHFQIESIQYTALQALNKQLHKQMQMHLKAKTNNYNKQLKNKQTGLVTDVLFCT